MRPVAVAVACLIASQAQAEEPVMPPDADVANGAALYSEHCAACHGANLEGQPNWRSPDENGRLPAPPHDETGHTWHHGDSVLFRYTKLGGHALMAQEGIAFDSGMPGFAETLGDDDIWDILAFIQSTWSDRAREIQAMRTKAEALRSTD